MKLNFEQYIAIEYICNLIVT